MHQEGKFLHVGSVNPAQTTAGTGQSDAKPVTAGLAWIPTASANNAGVILQNMAMFGGGMIVNADQTNTVLVYPPVGCNFNGAATNGSISLPPKGSIFYMWFDNLKCGAVLS